MLAKIIGIVSGKGGVGKTTLVTNLALALKNLGKKVAVVDCNVTTPHLTHYLGAHKYSLYLNDVLRGDVSMNSASYYHDGITIVPASPNVEDLIDVDIMKLKNALKRFQKDFGMVLLDSAPGLGREALAVLQASEEIIYVTIPYLPAVEDVMKCEKVLKNFKAKTIGLILNMVRDEEHELSAREVEALTKIPVIGKIPYDKHTLKGLAKKTPVVNYNPYSNASLECKKIAGKLLGIVVNTKRPSRVSDILKRFFGKEDEIKLYPEFEGLYFDKSIKTDADRILDFVRLSGSIGISELSRKANLPKDHIRELGRILESHGLVEFQSSFFREERLKIRNA